MKRIFLVLSILGGFSFNSSLPMNRRWEHQNEYRRECPVCYDRKPEHEFRRLYGCNHQIQTCRECFADYLRRRIQADAAHDVRCSQCRAPLHDGDMRWYIQDQNIINQYRQLQQAERDRLAHLRAQGLTSEKRKMIWRGTNMDACPNCHEIIQKNGGCNHMTCRRDSGGCGYEFCWLCMTRWPGYGHFCNPVFQVTTQLTRHHPAKLIIGAIVIAGAGYGAYRLYNYLNQPKAVPVKDLKSHLEDLAQCALQCKHILEKGIRPSELMVFLNTLEQNNALKDLGAVQLNTLKKLVADFDKAVLSGNCDKQYAALITFISKLQLQEIPAQKNVKKQPIRANAVKSNNRKQNKKVQ